MDVVVVESPAKAKTINKYLGDDFVVLASYGHVRDLPSKDGSVLPDEDFAMTYRVDERSRKPLKAIANALSGAERLYLATDPDREGEAISWHVLEALQNEKAMKDVEIKRVVFNEITRPAVLAAMAEPRDLDMDLVNAQQARRALDYLVGFTLSPVLWRKLPGARSAGRVQSVALRLICDRELEIEKFRPQEYWTIDVDLLTGANEKFTARLNSADGKKLGKFDIPNITAAEALAARLKTASYSVLDLTTKPTKRNPQPPFTTSTLQQEASRKLGFGARRTMDIAQRLYEGIEINGETVGLITYMRTDGVQISNVAIDSIRQVIDQNYGADYVPDAPRIYRTKAKNAQEAHEAIRPTDADRSPEMMKRILPDDQFKLYQLIWRRTVASQMESAQLLRTTIDITTGDQTLMLRATGSVLQFPGFLKLYEEGRDEPADQDDEKRLPKVQKADALSRQAVRPDQHFTDPPPRYTEATLVKKLEELGIGRPSTYAQILSVLQEREYAALEKGRFIPHDKGRMVTAFLASFFTRYVGYDFTAHLETELDEISASRLNWKDVLRRFWDEFSLAVGETKDLRVSDVLEALNEILGPHIFPPREDGGDARACPSCENGRLSLKLGRFGAFIGCSDYPDCKYTRKLDADASGSGIAEDGPVELGIDPESQLNVSLRKGPYGLYVQLGEATEEVKKPKRASLPKDVPPEDLSLEMALRLLALPRDVGPHPESGKMITAGLGRFGPFVACDGKYGNLASTEEVLTVGLNRAVTVLAESKSRGRRPAAEPLRVVGKHPSDDADIRIMNGRYGPYITHNKVNVTVPKGTEPDTVTLQQAVDLLAEKAAKKGTKTKAKAKPKAKAEAKPKTKSTKSKSTAKSTAASRKKAAGKSKSTEAAAS